LAAESSAFLNVGQILPKVWPSFLPTLPEDSILDSIWVLPPELDASPGTMALRTELLLDAEFPLGLPGVDAISLVIGGASGGTLVPIEIKAQPDFSLSLHDVPLTLRFSDSLLKPVRKAESNGSSAAGWEVDPTLKHVDITVGSVSLSVNGDGDVALTGGPQIDLPPVMIADTGIVIEAHGIDLYLDSAQPPPGQPAGWRGVHIGSASLYLPGELGEILGQLSLSNAYIGNGGFTGTIATSWQPAKSASLFGFAFTIEQVSIAFVQNALTASSIKGTITLPFFDGPVPVEIAVNLNGSFTVLLSSPDGLFELKKPGIADVKLNSLGFSLENNLFTARLSGTLTPDVAGLEWPGFEVRELDIDSNGNVRIDGGWLTLREQYALDFHGFTLEITKLGFGSEDDGSRWVGFSGGLKLVDGIKAGASVKGLRVAWQPGGGASVSFEGVGVEFEIPGTLRFKGEIAYRHLDVNGEDVHRFDGAIKLELISLGLEIDANLVIGYASGPDGSYAFLAMYLGVELPAGIPLWSTGLALYGLAGLFAMNMEPDKQPDEPWYGMAPGEGWYKRPQIGVTDLNSKWVNSQGAFALGGGITIGTLPDNGFTFNGKMLLLIVFPGPILMIEGKANILKERASLGDDPIFRCLVVLDFRAGDLTVGLDAHYQVDDSGTLIDIAASAEMYFNFSDPTIWHLYLGMRDPRERRIRAHILKLFESNSYFMLDAKSLAMGAWIGYEAHWSFGPLGVGFEAWIESNVQVNWKPIHFHGDLWAHGKAELTIFMFSLGLTIDAKIAGDVFDPFHLLGEFSVGIELPWPLDDVSVSITLEWGPEPIWPAAPLPLKEVAIEHFKVSTSWPLPRSANLLAPNYDDGKGFRFDWTAAQPFDTNAPPSAAPPIVPLDCRPHVTFSRAVHDVALVGVNATPVTPPEEIIGDPDKQQGPVKAKYELREVALDAWAGAGWNTLARTAAPDLGPNAAGVDALYGSWAPTPSMPDGGGDNKGQTKLWLWSKNPYDYTRHGGREWEEWISGRFDDDPCIQRPEQTETCWTFDDLPPGPISTLGIASPQMRVWEHPDVPGLIFAWTAPESPSLGFISTGKEGRRKAICLPAFIDGGRGLLGAINVLLIQIPAGPNRGLRVHCRDAKGVSGFAYDAQGKPHSAAGGTPSNPVVEFNADDIRLVMLVWQTQMCFWSVCIVEGASNAEIAEAETIAQHNIDELERWKNTGTVLKPHTSYRLLVRTRITGTPLGSGLPGGVQIGDQNEYAFFRTEGPPALVDLSLPIGAPKPDEIALRNKEGHFVHVDGTTAAAAVALDTTLNDLAPYVRQTTPPTVPAPGEDRPLPRPVYRGYDVGVAFNEDYVSQMYRMDGRDLAIYLYDSNNRPVRDPQGRLIVITTNWDRATALELDQNEKTWVTTVQQSSCATIDTATIPHDETLASSGLVLEPDFVHEARVTPLLLHESFPADAYPLMTSASGNGAQLGRWVVEDLGGEAGPSTWQIEEVGIPAMRVVRQTSNLYSLPLDAALPAKPGTTLLLAARADLPAGHPNQPDQWTDYRVSVQLRSADDDAVGVTFRRMSTSQYYRFSMDRERRYRRLVRVVGGQATILAEDDFVYRSDQDYVITVEAIGTDIAVYQDGAPVFRVNDDATDHGGIGLYCWASEDAQFADIRVDDFRETARPAYRFQFTTSLYANFVHQTHSYQDETWLHALPAAKIASAAAAAVAAAGPPSDAEARAWSALEADADWGALLRPKPQQTEVTRIEDNGFASAFLVRCPEPFDWHRVGLTLQRAAGAAPRIDTPVDLKLIGVTRHASDPDAESVTLVVRAPLNPTGYKIQQRRLPGPLAALPDADTLLADEFDQPGGVLFEETFGANALDLYEIVDQGNVSAPSAWSIVGGSIRQTANIYGGPFTKANAVKQGTMAIIGSPDWTDVRITVTLTSGDNDSIGVVFRYNDSGNYYRFEMNREFGYRRLIKASGGQFYSSLWQTDVTYTQLRAYALEIVAAGPHLYGFLDGALLFHVVDAEHRRGRFGLYCWANEDSRYENLSAEAVSADPLLWHPAFAGLAEFRSVDALGATGRPSAWQAANDGALQTANVNLPDGGQPDQFGTFLRGGGTWSDVHISLRLQSNDPNAMGLMFRVADENTYYRFSMNRQSSYRRLVKVVSGAVTVLWQDSVKFAMNHNYALAVRAVGADIEVWLDGAKLVSTSDDEIAAGGVALYAYANGGVRFSDLWVFDAARRVGRWSIIDQGNVNTPSDWRLGGGALKQKSNLWGGNAAPVSPLKPGTLAIAGETAWRDYRVTVECSADDDDAIGVVFRYRDPKNYYLFALDAERSYRRLVKVANGAFTILWQSAGGYTVGDPLRLTVDAIGERLSGYLGATRLFTVTDPDHGQGCVGLYCWANDGARFDRVEVTSPPRDAFALLRDNFAGPGLAPWTVVDKGTVSAPSLWSVANNELVQSHNIYEPPVAAADPAKEGTYVHAGDLQWQDIVLEVDLQSDDDDAIGVMFRYRDDNNYYRFSMDRERSYRRLVSKEAGAFRVLWEDAIKYETGHRYRLTIVAEGNALRGFIDGLPVFSVRDEQHAQGSVALYCWAVEGARFRRLRVYPAAVAFHDFALDENFAALRTFRWSFVDEGDVGAPSSWDVADSRLVQTRAISGSDPQKALGTLAIAGEADWTDYRLSAALRATAPGAIGVVFRRLDDQHYYRFAMSSATGARTLVRRSGDTFTSLWSDAGGLQIDRTYLVTVDCLGSSIAVYLNGYRILLVDDAMGPASGGIGLYCHGTAGNEFFEARVALPQWSPYYRFGREEKLAAGTRLRVYSGKAAAPGVGGPLESARFATAQFDQADIQFVDRSIDLRVVGPKANEHARRFAPNDTYSTVTTRVLRKADGTEFLIFRDGPNAFATGQYRLALEYRRNISAADPNAPVLSEQGVEDSEYAQIDMPWLTIP
jgi:hypothetical protein